jgi:glycosyltransferase involved in cell wall biosynthesis
VRSRVQPLVSIVTPVYNGAAHLAECIESILAQSYEQWDYTIVDNCSSDGSLEIARRYAAMDPRIRVRSNERFLGAIANHNVAMRQISPESKYCKMVFGDDRIFPRCVEEMVAVAEEYPSAGVVGAYCLYGDEVRYTGIPCSDRLVLGRDICRQAVLERLYVFGSANCLLYRADLVRKRDPFYNEANIHADSEVCFDLLRESDFGFVHQVLTFTRERPGSLTSVSAAMQTDHGGMLRVLMKHGPGFLTPDELSRQRTECLRKYYRFLSKSLLLRRSAGFWDHHREAFRDAGVRFSRARLALATAENVVRSMVRPVDAVRKALGPTNGRRPEESGKSAT